MTKTKKIHDSSLALRLFLLCWMVYFSSYLGRLNYSSAMTVMLDTEIITKAQAGFISMIYFLAYGIGQCLNGFAGDKVNPKNMITCGLIVSAGMNLIMTFSRNFLIMTAAWLVNGYAQSTIWPPIIRIFSEMLETKIKLKYCVDIVSTQAAGTFASYFLSAAIIACTKWQFVFLAATLILSAAAVIWNIGFSSVKRRAQKEQEQSRADDSEESEWSRCSECCQCTKQKQEIYGTGQNQVKRQSDFFRLLSVSGSLILIFPILVHGILKDGVVSWVPTFLSETFKSGAHTAILLTSVIPIINLSGAYAGKFVFRKMKNDEIRASVLFFAISAAGLFILFQFGNRNIFLTVFLLSVVTVSMMAVNTLLINIYPLRFEQDGRVASMSGFLNASAYVGTAISTYCIGILVQSRGWETTIFTWFLTALAALGLCIIACKKISASNRKD
ncbi:UNVERIFIED_ORG: hypothetical protein B5F06_04600 [Lacrimispora saccharolytica]